jgi:membrane peptidoglycan carboxypeptidase
VTLDAPPGRPLPSGQPGRPLPAGAPLNRGQQYGGARPGPSGRATGAPGATEVFPPSYEVGPPPGGYRPGGHTPQPGRVRPQVKQVKPGKLIDYPRASRTGWTRWFPSWKLIAGLSGFGIVTMMLGIFAAYSATDLPPIDASTQAQTTVIYFSDGKTRLSQLASQDRQNITLKQVPKHVQDAVMAAEDHSFRTNMGVEPSSIARAVLSNLKGNSLQGGSTISQQYVKNVYDQRDRSLKRKAKELFLAVKVNQEFSKDQILEQYLNTIYLGEGAYGIQAASHAYFGPSTDVSELTVSQGAFLAGIINAPSLADDLDDPKEKARAVRRWGVVLDAMVDQKWLDPTERASLKFPQTIDTSASVTLKGQNGYLRDMVVQEADKLGYDEDDLRTGGYKITSTFDVNLVKAGVKAINTMLPKQRPKGLSIGMASVDPSTGAVKAIYGGAGGLKYKGASTNNATLATAEAGSTFKAFGLIAALEDGYSLKTEYNSDSPVTVAGQRFRNAADGESSGYQDLVRGTAQSLNTVYAQLNNDVGPRKAYESALKAGIPENANMEPNQVGNVLGSANPHVIDVASAYATFASGGVRRPTFTIEKISKLGTKDVEYDQKDAVKEKRVFDADSVADFTFALRQVVESNAGTGTYAQRLNRPVAGKTGTSQDARSAWFTGYTPQLSTSVVMYQLGKNKNKDGEYVPGNVPMKGFGQFRSIFGGGYPTMIWTEYMKAALDGEPVKDFPDPVYGGEIKHRAPVVVQPTQDAEPSQDATPTPTADPFPPTETAEPPDPTTTEPAPTIEEPTVDPTDDGNGDGNGNNNQ